MKENIFSTSLSWMIMALLLSSATISGCAATSEGHSSFYSVDRAADYPVKIVEATFVPPFEIEIEMSGKTDGALHGAGKSIKHISPLLVPGLAFGGPLGVVILAPIAVLVAGAGAVMGAWIAAPKAEVDPIQLALQNNQGNVAQEILAEKAQVYLAGISEQSVSRVGPEVIGPKSISDRPEYRPTAPDAHGSLLELSLLEIRYEGSGENGAPVCLNMAARGRKIDAATGTVIDALDFSRTIECQSVAKWTEEGGLRFGTALENGYRILAENLIDELYLIYYPPRHEQGTKKPERLMPEAVLAPISPQAPDMYLDFKLFSNKRDRLNGGLHFVDIDSLTPTLSWEAFPRSFDTSNGENHFTNISYDVRIYSDSQLDSLLAPRILLHEVNRLVEPYYSLVTPLQPCSRYFWTVRASFDLNGSRRVTEWAGAYKTPFFEVSPSNSRRGGRLRSDPYDFYYPFRTPGTDDTAVCWD